MGGPKAAVKGFDKLMITLWKQQPMNGQIIPNMLKDHCVQATNTSSCIPKVGAAYQQSATNACGSAGMLCSNILACKTPRFSVEH